MPEHSNGSPVLTGLTEQNNSSSSITPVPFIDTSPDAIHPNGPKVSVDIVSVETEFLLTFPKQASPLLGNEVFTITLNCPLPINALAPLPMHTVRTEVLPPTSGVL